jgi:HSP20 family molecular chaperone IbpA
MALTTRNHAPVRNVRDPFSMARELLSWDPFFGGRPATAFSPAFEVKETADSFVLKADLPGVAEGDLDIGVHNNVLTVSGSRSAEERKEGETYALYERQFGSFTRSFSLPDMADQGAHACVYASMNARASFSRSSRGAIRIRSSRVCQSSLYSATTRI